jgi:hypothetical protein
VTPPAPPQDTVTSTPVTPPAPTTSATTTDTGTSDAVYSAVANVNASTIRGTNVDLTA